MSTVPSDGSRKRGRPPNERARLRVLAAARELMAEGGIGAVTIEALAVRTGVTRPTIYRHWPNAQAVAMAALIEHEVPETAATAPATLEQDLERELLSVVAAFSTATGRSALMLVAAADPSTELAKAFRHHLLLRSRDNVRARLLLAVEEGDLPAESDVECLADLVLAPLFFRLLVGHAPVTPSFARSCIQHLMRGFPRRSPGQSG